MGLIATSLLIGVRNDVFSQVFLAPPNLQWIRPLTCRERDAACTGVVVGGLSHHDMLSISPLPRSHVIGYTPNGAVMRPMCPEGQTALFSLCLCNYINIRPIRHETARQAVRSSFSARLVRQKRGRLKSYGVKYKSFRVAACLLVSH